MTVFRWVLDAAGLAAMAAALTVAVAARPEKRRGVLLILACFAAAVACFETAGRLR